MDLASCAAADERATVRSFSERELAALTLTSELLDTGRRISDLRHMVQYILRGRRVPQEYKT